MKAVSNRRVRENRQRHKLLVRLVRERGELCEVALPGCDGRAVDGHEVLARSAGGSPVDEENIRLVCRPCHVRIGARPLEALELGFRRSSYGGDV